MNKEDLVAIRAYQPGDKNFILATFLRGLYYGESWYAEIPKRIFMENYHKIIDYLLTNPTTTITIACLKDDPDVILGYSILGKSPEILHWVFVKKAWRGIGIAKSLVPNDVTTVTHLTKIGTSISKAKQLIFNPFVL